MQGWNGLISSPPDKIHGQDGALASLQRTLHGADAVALSPYHYSCLFEKESIT